MLYVEEYLLATIGAALWLYLPAYFANGSAVIGGHIWCKPIDGGRIRADGTRILGDGKTWGGLLFGTFIAFIGGIVEMLILPHVSLLETLVPHVKGEYSGLIGYDASFLIPVRAAITGFGALVGDMIKSYFKRKRKIKRGDKFIPWDQLDFILGATLFMLPFTVTVPAFVFVFLFILLVTPPIHIGTNIIAYKLGLKDNPW